MPRKSRNTKQKEIIDSEIDKFQEFFTVEELYDRIKVKHSEIGLATVYRFMKQLRDEKRVFTYTCNNKLLYSKNKKSHCHFICEESGKVIHFDIDTLDFLKDKIPGSITSFQIEVRGKCKDCCRKGN